MCECCRVSGNSEMEIDEPPEVASDDEVNGSDHEEEMEGLSDGDAAAEEFVPNFEPPMTRQRFLRNKLNDDDYDIVSIEVVESDDDGIVCALGIDRTKLFKPKTYKQAISCEKCKEWVKAMKEELDSLIKYTTWEVVSNKDVPDDAARVTCRWLYDNQVKPSGIRQKARVIAQGFKDTTKYEEHELFAPVSCQLDLRIIIHFSNQYDLNLRHVDVKSAFLNGKLENEIYMNLPPGLAEYMGELQGFEKTHFLKLIKSIYGLKVSPKRWFLKFTSVIKKLRLKQYEYRPCLYYWKEGNKMVIILIYVDDMLIASNDDLKEQEVIKGLREEFTISDLGEAKLFLGVQIERDRKN